MKQDLKDFDCTVAKESPLTTFERLLQISNKEELTDGGAKRMRRLLLCCIVSMAGKGRNNVDADSDEIEELAKSVLDDHFSMRSKELVAACWVRLLSDLKAD